MRNVMTGLVLFLILCYPAVGRPQERAVRVQPFKLTLQEAIFLALANNIDIKIERLQPQIAETDVEAEESVFDPSVRAEVSEGSSKEMSPVAPFLTGSTEPFQITTGINAGLEKRFTTGATAQLAFDNNRLSSNSFVQRFNPSWGTDLNLSMIQPLLKGFGREFNLGGIVIAKNNKNISDLQFKKRSIDIITAVKEAYWDLVRAIERLDVAEQSVRLAQDLLEINKAKAEVGQLAPIDVVEAEAGVAAREEAVILAEDTIGDVEDRLKALLNLNGEPRSLVQSIIPMDRPMDVEIRFSLTEEIQTALKNRPDYLQAKTELENRIVSLKLAKNLVRPRLDMVASAGVNGLGHSYADALDELDGDFYDLRIGLRFEYPLKNRAAKSQLVRSKLERRQVELRLDDLEKNIALEVSEAIRQVETNLKRIQTTRVSRRLSEKKLEAEQTKFEVGISTTKDVLDFQVDLAFARSREVEAITDYNKALERLYQLLGTTLEENAITANMLEKD